MLQLLDVYIKLLCTLYCLQNTDSYIVYVCIWL